MLCHQKPGAWRNKAGEPCRQGVSNDPAIIGCIHHRGDPETVKRMQQKGGYMFAAALRAKRGALPDSTPELALGTVAEIDQEIKSALEHLRRGRLGERKAEVLIGSLHKLRALRIEDAAPAPKPPMQVSIGWGRPPYCERCTCPPCEAVKRQYGAKPEPARGSEVA
jgi:hypothetical protein